MINPVYAETLFNFLYTKVDGYYAARISQAAKPGSSEELLYGEIPFDTWEEILKRVTPKQDGIFYDLGSGLGRVAMQSHILCNFRKSIGIELLDGLHNEAVSVKNTFERIIKPQIAKHLENRELMLRKDNILTTDFSDADLVLLSHPFKEEDDFLKLEEKFLRELKPKTKIITLIRFLRNDKFKDCGFGTYHFSWGKSNAYFYEIP